MRTGLRMNQLKTTVRRRFEDSAPIFDYVELEPDVMASNQDRVLSLLTIAAERGEPMTVPQLIDATGIISCTLQRIIAALRERNAVIAVGQSEKLGNNKRARLYRAVLPEDQLDQMLPPKQNFVRGFILPILIEARNTGTPISAQRLAELAQCSKNGVRQHLRAMVDKREVVIAGKMIAPHETRASGVRVQLYAAAEWLKNE